MAYVKNMERKNKKHRSTRHFCLCVCSALNYDLQINDRHFAVRLETETWSAYFDRSYRHIENLLNAVSNF